jgi:uncharacterized protein (DUF305 family)
VIVAGRAVMRVLPHDTTFARHEDDTLRTPRPLRALTAAALSALLLTACGQDTGEPVTGTPTETDEPAAADTPTGDEADVEFVQQMIPHHEGAIEMAELVYDRTDRTELHELADEIIEVQDAEIELLEGMLDRFGAERMPTDGDGHGMDHGEMGMADDEAMAALEAADGEEFDRLFLELMIEHHQGAIDMANDVVERGSDPEVAGLAEAVIAAQQVEIEQMHDWQQAWGL